METVEINIVGTDCGGCVSKHEKGLRALPSVQEVNVTLDPGKAVVKIDPEIIGADILEEIVVELGYKVAA
jgi:copper chaperone CopZ